MIKILFICYGNICRSTMAESVMTVLVERAGLSDRIKVASAGTSTEEIGNPPHYGTVQKLREKGIPVVPHRAVQLTKNDYRMYDYLIGMEQANVRSILRICNGDPEKKVYRLLTFAGEERDIADPWYTGRFSLTYEDVKKGCEALLLELKRIVEV